MRKGRFLFAMICSLLSGSLLIAMMWNWIAQSHRWLTISTFLVFLLSVLQVVPSRRRNLTTREMGDLIERFLQKRSLYPQEWNDFVERSQMDKEMDKFRKRCYQLDPLVNRPGQPDEEAVSELQTMVRELREQPQMGVPGQ